MKTVKNQCDKCICTYCINQPVCAKSCDMCKTLGGYVGFCVDQCKCEQIEFVEEESCTCNECGKDFTVLSHE